MMISTLNFQFNLAQLALKILGGLILSSGGEAKARLAEFKPDLSRRIFVEPPRAKNFWTGRN
jgi:hypothetical protein